MSYVLDIILLLLAYLLGFARGHNHRKNPYQNEIDNTLNTPEDLIDPVPNITRINVEKIGIVFYAYDVQTQIFLGQGTTKQELFDAIRTRHPSTDLSMTRENIKQIGWSDE